MSNSSRSSGGAEEHRLDDQPGTFLDRTNSDIDTVAWTARCTPDTIVIPEIPHRCFVNWTIGARVAAGTGAVVFGVDDEKNTRQVARISQFHTKANHRNFVRDVQARYLLSSRCGTIPITGLIDAFICTTKGTSYGVTITHRYEGTLVDRLLTRRSVLARAQFVDNMQLQLISLVRRMHECGIVHRDLHQGNILLDTDDVLILTDFESAGGPYFNTTAREFSAYTHSDRSAVCEIVVELRTICQYLEGEIRNRWIRFSWKHSVLT